MTHQDVYEIAKLFRTDREAALKLADKSRREYEEKK